MLSNFEKLSLTLNNSNIDENLLATNNNNAANNLVVDDAGNLIGLSTQNYVEKYKDLENLLTNEKKTNEEIKKYYKVLKTDHTK